LRAFYSQTDWKVVRIVLEMSCELTVRPEVFAARQRIWKGLRRFMVPVTADHHDTLLGMGASSDGLAGIRNATYLNMSLVGPHYTLATAGTTLQDDSHDFCSPMSCVGIISSGRTSSSNKDPHSRSVLRCGCRFFVVAVAGDTPIFLPAPGADSSQITIPFLDSMAPYRATPRRLQRPCE